MSALERRVALLLDAARHDALVREASATGRSVGSLIREAIDLRYQAAGDGRATAAAQLLAMTHDPGGETEPDWLETKGQLEDVAAGRTR